MVLLELIIIIYLVIRKVPYKLSSSRKRGIRERLKNAEKIIDLLNSTGINTKSLVIYLEILLFNFINFII